MSCIFDMEIASQSREDLRNPETPSSSDEHISSWNPRGNSQYDDVSELSVKIRDLGKLNINLGK